MTTFVMSSEAVKGEQTCLGSSRPKTSARSVRKLSPARTCMSRSMEYVVSVLLLVAMATWTIQPTSGQGWTYQPIGGGWQSDEEHWEEETDVTDYRYINYRTALKSGAIFQDWNLISSVQLVVDEDREQLLAGGRDVLFRLNLDTLVVKEMTPWTSDLHVKEVCQKKGQKEETCHNFIRVLIIDEDKGRVLACGTNAFDPTCTWRKVDSLSTVLDSVDGRGICPFSPDHNSTALLASTGDLFASTVIDFSARDPAITRQFRKEKLRTMQHNSKWLNEPNFISAYEIGNYVYFFFRETAVEYINCGKRIFSRVARLCKDDEGGVYSMKGIFTSYNKARMNCSLPGEYPFYFDDLQSTFYSFDEQLVYGVFTTPPNSIAGSAVCVYDISAFTEAFDGPFKHQESHRSAWFRQENQRNDVRKGKCGSNDKRESGNVTELFDPNVALTDDLKLVKMASRYQLMDRAVRSREMGPLIMREHERWTHIVVDHVPSRDTIFDVLFLATEDGKIRKMMRLPGTNTTCLIEEIKIVANGHPRPVKNMKISPPKGAIYISTEGDIIKVPVQRCYRFTTHVECLNANDPYCGWNTHTDQCTPAPYGNPTYEGWEHRVSKCPILDYPVHGQWSDWSDWNTCRQVGLDRMVDHCLCRSRACDRPKPRNQGRTCMGPSMEVSNCTVHGGWTSWSAWSSCTQTCGLATRSRSRQCGNPPPKFGGHDCVGEARDVGNCQDNPECPLMPLHGRWSSWSGWTSCNKNCNGGSQTRKRRCSPPMRGGDRCFGNEEQWRSCNTQNCPELVKKMWSQWIVTNNTQNGTVRQRFKFSCRAPVEDSRMIKASVFRTKLEVCGTDKTDKCLSSREVSSQIMTIDAFSKVDRMLKKYCRRRRRLFKKFCKCRTLGVFLVCQKCGLG